MTELQYFQAYGDFSSVETVLNSTAIWTVTLGKISSLRFVFGNIFWKLSVMFHSVSVNTKRTLLGFNWAP